MWRRAEWWSGWKEKSSGSDRACMAVHTTTAETTVTAVGLQRQRTSNEINRLSPLINLMWLYDINVGFISCLKVI